jgi:ABC-2 type transport system ATP-binding protein
VESQKGFVRGDLARSVVEAGWDLNELRPTAMSLEEIFLQLTGKDAAEAEKPAATQGAQA